VDYSVSLLSSKYKTERDLLTIRTLQIRTTDPRQIQQQSVHPIDQPVDRSHIRSLIQQLPNQYLFRLIPQ
jgi:hypothetical protein